MRIIKEGELGNLLPLTTADLPEDKDLKHSFFRYVDMSGLDFTGYDMRDMDVLLCKAHGVVLPGHEIDGVAATDYLCSRMTDWEGSTIPGNISSYHQDIVPELFKQKAQARLTVGQKIWGRVFDHLKGSVLASWQDSFWKYRNVWTDLQVNDALFRTFVSNSFGDYPRITARMEAHLSGRENVKEEPPISKAIYKSFDGLKREYPALDGLDRWANARALEEHFAGQHDPVHVYVHQIEPLPIVFCVPHAMLPEPRLGWWGAWQF